MGMHILAIEPVSPMLLWFVTLLQEPTTDKNRLDNRIDITVLDFRPGRVAHKLETARREQGNFPDRVGAVQVHRQDVQSNSLSQTRGHRGLGRRNRLQMDKRDHIRIRNTIGPTHKAVADVKAETRLKGMPRNSNVIRSSRQGTSQQTSSV